MGHHFHCLPGALTTLATPLATYVILLEFLFQLQGNSGETVLGASCQMDSNTIKVNARNDFISFDKQVVRFFFTQTCQVCCQIGRGTLGESYQIDSNRIKINS